MTNLEKYIAIFTETLRLSVEEVKQARFKETWQWDSVCHVGLISRIEVDFDISLEPDDLLDFTSFAAGLEILPKYGISF